jgi:hypothetical protein
MAVLSPVTFDVTAEVITLDHVEVLIDIEIGEKLGVIAGRLEL